MKELIERLKRTEYDDLDACKAADTLERMESELETANRITTEQIDYAIGLQRAIEAHCREELAPEDVCPHHAEKLNEHFNQQRVIEKEHTEFYSEVVTLRSTVEHLRLREGRLTAERDALKEGLDGWHSRYLDVEVERDALAQNADRVRVYKQRYLEAIAERDALRADAKRYWLQEKPCGDIWLHAKYFSVNLGHKESTDPIYKAMQESARIDAAIGEKK